MGSDDPPPLGILDSTEDVPCRWFKQAQGGVDRVQTRVLVASPERPTAWRALGCPASPTGMRIWASKVEMASGRLALVSRPSQRSQLDAIARSSAPQMVSLVRSIQGAAFSHEKI